MTLDQTPESLSCAECGEAVTDTGYVPATEADGAYDLDPDAAVCDACGFNELGMLGCAPELDEVTDPATADVLLYVRRTDDGLDVVSEKE